MIFYEKTIEDIGHGAQCYHDACAHAKPIASESALISPSHDGAEMNLSGIQTALIQITGRFCESYASDLICTLADLQPFIRLKPITEPNKWVIPVGIRSMGVDHEGFITARLEETKHGLNDYVYTEQKYRKILAIEIVDEKTKDIDTDGYYTRTINLYDITHSLVRLYE